MAATRIAAATVRGSRWWSSRRSPPASSTSTPDQTSILRFIEDNWQTGKVGNFSFDTKGGPLQNMFDFNSRGYNRDQGAGRLILDPATGQPARS